jgi:hypothetical protein
MNKETRKGMRTLFFPLYVIDRIYFFTQKSLYIQQNITEASTSTIFSPRKSKEMENFN